MERFTNEELYEIEKNMDIMAGWINDNVHKKIGTAIHCGISDKFKKYNDILDKKILSLEHSERVMRSIRDKCEQLRKKDQDFRNQQKNKEMILMKKTIDLEDARNIFLQDAHLCYVTLEVRDWINKIFDTLTKKDGLAALKKENKDCITNCKEDSIKANKEQAKKTRCPFCQKNKNVKDPTCTNIHCIRKYSRQL